MHPAPLPALGYHAMRLRWCGLALLAFLRRWGIYVIVAAAVAGAGAVGYLQIIGAVAAWLVLPLFYAAGHGAWLIAAMLLQSLAGAAAVFALRALLWPLRWAEAERALPLTAVQTRLSDTAVVAIALLPLALLYTAGAATLLGHAPDWLRPVRSRALASLVTALLLSLALGVALLQAMRRPRGLGRAVAAATAAVRRGGAVVSTRLAWPLALLLLPLWRGPARRCGQAVLGGTLLAAVPAAAVLVWPATAAWWLAGFAVIALTVATRVDTLAREELTPLLDACAPLPLAATQLQRGRSVVGLLPVLPTLAALALALPANSTRPVVLAAYALVVLGSCALQLRSASADAGTQSGRWLFCLVLCVCMATEVMR